MYKVTGWLAPEAEDNRLMPSPPSRQLHSNWLAVNYTYSVGMGKELWQ